MTEQQAGAPPQAGTTGTQQAEAERGKRRVAVGVVIRDKMNKTRRVEIARLVKHPRYNKYIKRRTVCYVHDERNESHTGDTVEIMESRPLSKLKRWRLVRVVTRGPGGQVAGKPAQQPTPPASPAAEQAGTQQQP